MTPTFSVAGSPSPPPPASSSSPQPAAPAARASASSSAAARSPNPLCIRPSSESSPLSGLYPEVKQFDLAAPDLRKADVVLGERCCGRPRGADVRELGALQPGMESVPVVGHAVEHGGHPPREVLRGPHPQQAGVGVALEKRGVAGGEPLHERLGQHAHVGHGQVQALGPGGRHDVDGVAGQEQAPVLHGLGHEAAHRGDALLDDRPLLERPALAREASVQLLPDPLIRPALDVLVGLALEVEAGDLRRAHAVEREAAVVVAVDELIARGLDLGQDAEPAEWVGALAVAERAVGHGGAADAVVAVAARPHLAAEVPLLALVPEAEQGAVGLDARRADVVDLEQQWCLRLEAGGDQVLYDLLLAVDRDPASACELVERDPVTLAAEAKLDAVVDEALALQALADAHLDQEVHRPLLEHAGADASLDVVAAPILEDDGVDALKVEQVPEHQARRPRADYSDLRAGDVRCAHARIALLLSRPG